VPGPSQEALRVVVSLQAQSGTELQLIEALNMQPSALRKHIEELIALDLVHIAAYGRVRGNSQLVVTYAAGSKVRPTGRRRRPKNTERLSTTAR